MGLPSVGTLSLGGRSPNASPDKSPNVEKDKKLSPVDDREKIAEREKEKEDSGEMKKVRSEVGLLPSTYYAVRSLFLPDFLH